MEKKRVVQSIIFLVLLMSIFSVGMNLYLLKYFHIPEGSSTGQVTSSGTITLTQAGSSGLSLSDDAIAFGSGYYNSSLCSLGYALLNSNTSTACWTNTTAALQSEDVHLLSNSGTVLVNLTVSSVNLTDAEELYCGSASGCTSSATSGVLVQSTNNESDSCLSLTSNFENITLFNSNATVGLCNALSYVDNNDTIQVYVLLHIPSDSTTGNKTLYLNYEAVAL